MLHVAIWRDSHRAKVGNGARRIGASGMFEIEGDDGLGQVARQCEGVRIHGGLRCKF